MYFTAREVLWGGMERRRRSGESSYQHIAYKPRQVSYFPDTFMPITFPNCWVHTQAAAFPRRFKAPAFFHIADGTTAALMICMFMQYFCTKKYKTEIYMYFKETRLLLLLRGPRTEEALLLYEHACSKPAAGSGWQMDIFFQSLFLPPRQQERCCQAASVSAYSQRQIAERWVKSSASKQLIETWLLSEIPLLLLLLKNMLHSRVHIFWFIYKLHPFTSYF